MFDELAAVAIAIIIAYFIYKIFELFATRRERNTIINRIESKDIIEYVKLSSFGVGKRSGIENQNDSLVPTRVKMWPIRCGCILFGAGIGLVACYFISLYHPFSSGDYMAHMNRETVYAGCVCLGAGFGFIISTIIELIIRKRNK